MFWSALARAVTALVGAIAGIDGMNRCPVNRRVVAACRATRARSKPRCSASRQMTEEHSAAIGAGTPGAHR